jgi:hypothetical protein
MMLKRRVEEGIELWSTGTSSPPASNKNVVVFLMLSNAVVENVIDG